MKTILNIPKNIEYSKKVIKAGIIAVPLILLPACVNKEKSEVDFFQRQ